MCIKDERLLGCLLRLTNKRRIKNACCFCVRKWMNEVYLFFMRKFVCCLIHLFIMWEYYLAKGAFWNVYWDHFGLYYFFKLISKYSRGFCPPVLHCLNVQNDKNQFIQSNIMASTFFKELAFAILGKLQWGTHARG